MSLTLGQVQNNFLSSVRQPASHISKVASGWKKRKQQKKRKEAGIPLPTPIPATQLSDPSGTIACSHWEPFTKREGLLQIKNNSLPIKGNVSKHRKRNTTVGGG